jgi:hypothetical protein
MVALSEAWNLWAFHNSASSLLGAAIATEIFNVGVSSITTFDSGKLKDFTFIYFKISLQRRNYI